MIWEMGNQVNQFMYSDHYHCKICGRQIEFIVRLNWIVNSGVRALGVCQWCNLILIEYEQRKTLEWINFPT